MKTTTSKAKQNRILMNFRFPPEVVARLRRESEKTGAPITWILEKALAEYLAVKH